MLIISIDRKGYLDRKDVSVFLAGLRWAAFGTIPQKIRERNELEFERDCIAIHLNIGPKTLLGRLLKPIISWRFPEYLALMFFSAKPKYIPHNADIIADISWVVAKFLKAKGLKDAAAWAMPFPKGKWFHVGEV